MAVEDIDYIASTSNEKDVIPIDPDYGNETLLKTISEHLKNRIHHFETIHSIEDSPGNLNLAEKQAWVLHRHDVSKDVVFELATIKSVIDQKINELKEMGEI